jgi:hypothetical protein
MISGTLKVNGKSVPVKGRLRGEQITFSAGEAQYTGKVSGDKMEGSTKGGGGNWSATRSK